VIALNVDANGRDVSYTLEKKLLEFSHQVSLISCETSGKGC